MRLKLHAAFLFLFVLPAIDVAFVSAQHPRLDLIDQATSLHNWLTRVKGLFPELVADDFRLSRADTLLHNPDLSLNLMTHANTGKELHVLMETLEYCPDSTVAAHLLIHNLVESPSGWTPPGSPDSYVYLFETESHDGWPALTMGTSGWFASAGWIDNDNCLIVGTLLGGTGEQCHLHVWRLDLKSRTVLWYRGPVVETDQMDRLFAAWKAWLEECYTNVRWAWADD